MYIILFIYFICHLYISEANHFCRCRRSDELCFVSRFLIQSRVVHGSDGPAGRVGSSRVGSGDPWTTLIQSLKTIIDSQTMIRRDDRYLLREICKSNFDKCLYFDKRLQVFITKCL